MSEFNLDYLLAAGAEQLEQAPSIAIFPAGTHLVQVSLKLDLKSGKDKNLPAVKVEIVMVGTLEKTNPKDRDCQTGDKNYLNWFLKHPKEIVQQLGQGGLRNLATVLNSRFGERSNMQVIEDTQGQEVVMVSKIRKSKDSNDNDQENLEVVSWAMPDQVAG